MRLQAEQQCSQLAQALSRAEERIASFEQNAKENGQYSGNINPISS